MKEEITKQLAQEMLDILKSTKNFVLEQAPDLIRQLCVLKMWELALTAILGFVILTLTLWATVAAWKKLEDYERPLLMLMGFPGVFGAVMFCCGIMNFIKITVAPKIFLIEYLSGLLK